MSRRTLRSLVPCFLLSATLLATSTSPLLSQTIDEDLVVGWIHRLPELDYVPNSLQPDVEGWPAVGDTVVWQAVVRNWFPTDQTVDYRWLLDGVELTAGTTTLAAGSHTAVPLPWVWTFDRHVLRFEIDSGAAVTEFSEQNNTLEVFTDAISIGFWVEQSVYDYFHQYQSELGVGANSWEDWGQRHVARWNVMFADAVYPEAPSGVLDRIRCDKIVIVPDGALPLAWGYYPTNHPDTSDKTVDLMWGFPATLLGGSMYSDHTTISDNNPFYFEGSLLHELGHARYLVDVYGFNVALDQIHITEDGAPIAGTPLMPGIDGGILAYLTPYRGLMNAQYTYIDQYSTSALNLIAGDRAHNGNFNAPYNLGEFLQDLPDDNELTITDQGGTPLAGASVRIYQATTQVGVWYGKDYDDIPDLDLTADAYGKVLLGRCPFSSDGTVIHYWELSNAVPIVRVQWEGIIRYAFLPVTEFNFEYWRGNTTLGHYTLALDLGTDAASRPPRLVLHENRPNPFNPSTEIRFELDRESSVRFDVLTIRGERVATLCDGRLPAGPHVLHWNGRDDDGRALPSGPYLGRLSGGDAGRTIKMMLIR